MMYQRFAVGVMGMMFGLSCLVPANAQDSSVYKKTTTTNTCATPSSMCGAPSMVSTPVFHTPVSGQAQTVTYQNDNGTLFWNKGVSKTITLEPGFNQFTLDKLRWGDRVNLTLVNPTDQPLQVETVERRGRNYSVVVPPHSQQMLSFTNNRPFNDEAKLNVMVEPTSAMAANQAYMIRQAAVPTYTTVSTTEETTTEQTTTAETTPAPQEPERSSAVRGYW